MRLQFLAELELCDKVGIKGHDIVFSSNDTPYAEFKRAGTGRLVNLDDISMIEFMEERACRNGSAPATIRARSSKAQRYHRYAGRSQIRHDPRTGHRRLPHLMMLASNTSACTPWSSRTPRQRPDQQAKMMFERRQYRTCWVSISNSSTSAAASAFLVRKNRSPTMTNSVRASETL